MFVSIAGSVGFGGVNRKADVETVQTLLTKQGLKPGLIDGRCGQKTIGEIRKFQQRFLPVPDGLVSVNGVTWRKLISDQPVAPGIPVPASGNWSGDSSQWPQEKKLQSLNPNFRVKINNVLQDLKARNFRPKIVFGWRSVAVQAELHRLGRTKVLFSFHNVQHPDGTPNAYAVDIVDERWGWNADAETNGFWQALGQAGKAQGLVWGGDWTNFKDVAHLQGRLNSELAAAKRESGL